MAGGDRFLKRDMLVGSFRNQLPPGYDVENGLCDLNFLQRAGFGRYLSLTMFLKTMCSDSIEYNHRRT